MCFCTQVTTETISTGKWVIDWLDVDGDMTLIVLLIKKPSDKSIWVRGKMAFDYIQEDKKRNSPNREQYDPLAKSTKNMKVVKKRAAAHFHWVIKLPCHNTL